ncbi:hypothetical protein E2C01_040797 [Portunus trituberculatus]|uniref:Uncharacterized protein n=1 Tax=Portunus trituberculatus TaxID=210409 RepID=A0A5B7FPR1_PORTR|nr:hypothetical protein [Portunus trituberculatus]
MLLLFLLLLLLFLSPHLCIHPHNVSFSHPCQSQHLSLRFTATHELSSLLSSTKNDSRFSHNKPTCIPSRPSCVCCPPLVNNITRLNSSVHVSPTTVKVREASVSVCPKQTPNARGLIHGDHFGKHWVWSSSSSGRG